MLGSLELNVDNETAERIFGKYFYNLKKGKASNHNAEVISALTRWRHKTQIIGNMCI